jgi:hypothetical protein
LNGCRLVLEDMDNLMRNQVLSTRVVRSVPAFAKKDVVADGDGLGPVSSRNLGSPGGVVHARLGERDLNSVFQRNAQGRGKWFRFTTFVRGAVTFRARPDRSPPGVVGGGRTDVTSVGS